MSLNFNNFVSNNNNNIFEYNKSVEQMIKSSLNCCRIGIVEEFYPEEHVVKLKIANKILLGLNKDGSHINGDYAPIYAKVYYTGWHETQITYPIEKGSEGIVLFNDREIESWYVNGDVNTLKYNRMHEMTDAIFLAGLHSAPNILEFMANMLYLAYKTSNIQISDKIITINGDGDIILNGNKNIVFNGDETITANVSKSITNNSDETFTINCKKDTTINSDETFALKSPTITITGNPTITGNVVINGNLTVNGSITTTGDVVAGGVSLKSHKHLILSTGEYTLPPT